MKETKRFLATLLTLALLFTPLCMARGDVYIPTGDAPQFSGPDDPSLLVYLEDQITSGLEEQFKADGLIVRDVRAAYYSKEYMEEQAYNSQSNIFFGYTLAELDAQFEGTAYVFTLGEDGQTTVTEFQDYEDAYDKLFLNAGIGAGVILVGAVVGAVSTVITIPAPPVIPVTPSLFDNIISVIVDLVNDRVVDLAVDEFTCNAVFWKEEEPSEE